MHRFFRWREIHSATDAAAVEGLVDEYVQSIDPVLKKLLPDERQQALRDGNVTNAAVTLLHCELRFQGNPQLAEVLHEIAHMYAAASVRLAKLRRDPRARAP